MCVMLIFWLMHYVNAIGTAIALVCTHYTQLSLPFYLEIFSLQSSFLKSRASSRVDIVPFNTGGAENCS